MRIFFLFSIFLLFAFADNNVTQSTSNAKSIAIITKAIDKHKKEQKDKKELEAQKKLKEQKHLQKMLERIKEEKLLQARVDKLIEKKKKIDKELSKDNICLLYTSPSPRD